MQLLELQQRFARHILDEHGADELQQLVRINGIEGGRRLQIYRNNVRITLGEILHAIYPVFRALVGEDYFDSLAQRYAHQHRPHTGDVADYGDQLAEFAGALPELDSLKYLPDIARIEWACHLASRAPDTPHVSIEELGKFAASDHENLLLAFVPSVHVATSPFPIFDIWQFVISHSDSESDAAAPDMQSGDQAVMVMRGTDGVNVILLSEAEYQFAVSLTGGTNLAATVQNLFERFGNVDLQGILHKFFSLGTIAGIGTDSSS